MHHDKTSWTDEQVTHLSKTNLVTSKNEDIHDYLFR